MSYDYLFSYVSHACDYTERKILLWSKMYFMVNVLCIVCTHLKHTHTQTQIEKNQLELMHNY